MSCKYCGSHINTSEVAPNADVCDGTLQSFVLAAQLLCPLCVAWMNDQPCGHAQLAAAAAFASHAHRHQRRKNEEGEPYISHPLNVAALLARAGVRDADILAAAYLHDTLEDCDVTAKDILANFGPRVAAVVLQVTDNKRAPKAEQKRDQLARAATFSSGAMLVKLADICDNLGSFKSSWPVGWSRARVQGYFALKHAVVRAMVDTHPKLVPPLLHLNLESLWSMRLVDPADPEQGEFVALPVDKDAVLEEYFASI